MAAPPASKFATICAVTDADRLRRCAQPRRDWAPAKTRTETSLRRGARGPASVRARLTAPRSAEASLRLGGDATGVWRSRLQRRRRLRGDRRVRLRNSARLAMPPCELRIFCWPARPSSRAMAWKKVPLTRTAPATARPKVQTRRQTTRRAAHCRCPPRRARRSGIRDRGAVPATPSGQSWSKVAAR